jgi:hypothetical protein
MKQFMGLQKYSAEPSTLEVGKVTTLKGESENCSEAALKFLTTMHEQFIRTRLQDQRSPSRIIGVSTEPTLTKAQFTTTTPTPTLSTAPIEKPASAQTETGFSAMTAQPDLDSSSAKGHRGSYCSTSPLAVSPVAEHRFSHDSAISGALSLGKQESPPCPSFISSEDVRRCVNTNIEFLSRRQKARMEFEERLQAEIFLGVHNVPGNVTRMNRSHERSQSLVSEHSSFASWTPPARDYSSTVSTLAATLRLPGFGANVADGIEPVRDERSSIYSNGLMLVNEGSQSTPPASFRSIDSLMRHDSSFFAYGGFCEGAKMMLSGEKDFYKIVKRPVVSIIIELN